jgi:hypothetical protein
LENAKGWLFKLDNIYIADSTSRVKMGPGFDVGRGLAAIVEDVDASGKRSPRSNVKILFLLGFIDSLCIGF